MVPDFPALIGTVACPYTLEALPTLNAEVSACDLLEYRLDGLPTATLSRQPLPTLMTARDPEEGGQNALSLSQRHKLYKKHLPSASILDIEIRNLDLLADVRDEAQANARLVLGSFHDFDSTPSEQVLEDTIKRGIDAGADAIKLAVTTNTPHHIRILLRLLERYQMNIPMAVMGMGTLGKSSRVLFAQCGSILNYAYLKKANAPGQWSAIMMRNLFDEIGINRPA